MMQTNYYQLYTTMQVQGPIVSQHSGALQHGLDVAVLRDASGKPVLTGSFIKGNIRHALNEINAFMKDDKLTQWLQTWFGSEGMQATTKAELDVGLGQRSRLNFDFYWQMSNPVNDAYAVQNKIKLNQHGTTEKGSLRCVELPYRHGEKVNISGNIKFRATADEASIIEKYITKALQYCYALGSFKNIGFGKIEAVSLELIKPQAPSCIWPAFERDKILAIDWQVDRPLCIANAPTAKENTFKSQNIITGAILKGLVANHSSAESVLAKYLHAITFRHAKPLTAQGVLNQPARLSIAICHTKNEQGKKVSEKHDCLTSPAPLKGIMVFKPDFKEGDAKLVQNIATLPRVLLVRNAITQWWKNETTAFSQLEQRNTSAEQQLFSYDCVSHQWNNNEPITWRSYVDLSQIPDDQHNTVYDELTQLLAHSLHGLGKTKAIAHVTNTCWQARHTPHCEEQNTLYLTFYSPVCLLRPAKLNVVEPSKALYQHAFNELAPDVFELKDHYTCEELRGGSFWQSRFQRHKPYYSPYIETQPGSCFALTIKAGKRKQAQAFLTQWLHHGVPSVDVSEVELQQNNKQRWQLSPYDPANGFGEVAIEIVGDSIIKSETGSK
ncbi:RAMP superfamily CRISPR-associated protein [Pseudoalteromonas rhizosphaerae]|uniref:RAMP superfamily CRISPR-associated protein n=1 Tax=Pseudoalteromonas rhizosphaerae TaxID=2518973 RepID=UPI002148EAC0|nr:RAMP superfamily CRISPR-associated protein [Pseudoalteromonas rhizosphaerae]